MSDGPIHVHAMPIDDDAAPLPDIRDYDSAAMFLFESCPDSIKSNTELGLGSPESFACLLHRDVYLFRCIKNARTSRDLSGIWDICTDLSRPVEVNLLSPKPEIEVPLILNRIASKVKDLVSGKGGILPWTLDQNYPDSMSDIRKLDLQSLIEEERVPSMLFYELGNFGNEPDLNERVKNLFCKGQNKFLVNASATGKTRLLYEGLCQHWGLYITAHADDKEAGALDLTLGDRLSNERDFVRFLPRASALGFDVMLAKNREITYRRFSAVLLAHLYIFRTFLTAIHTHVGIIADIQKRRWLLAQIYSPLLDPSDPHREIIRAIELAPLDFIDEQLTLVVTDIRSLLPESVSTDGLYIAIDEANVAIRDIYSSQHGETGSYPALVEIIRTWRVRLALLEVPITFIVAGIEIPQEYFPSASEEWSSWRWTSDTGAFSDPETQRKFILPFLPPSFAESLQGQALLGRVWDWCRPRQVSSLSTMSIITDSPLRRRLTTSYIVMLLQDKLAHPHGVLDRWIEGLTGFNAFDSDEYSIEEGPCEIRPFFRNIGSCIARPNRPYVQSAAHEVIMTYIITGKHPACFDINKVDIVSSGVGEFKDKDMSVISSDQPGPTIAAAVWLSKASYSREEPRSLTSFKDFCSYFQSRWPKGDTYASASYIALYLAHAFKGEGNRLLSNIFTLLSAPSWLVMNRKVSTQLVMLQKDDHGIVKEFTITPSALLPEAPPLGYAASTPNDVVAWLRHERSGAFCLCPHGCGAHLIFVLRHRGIYVWVLLRTTGQGSTIPVDPGDLPSEFEKLSVENLFPNEVCSNLLFPSTEARSYRKSNLQSATELSDNLLNAFKALPNCPTGQLSLLRVVATFPSETILHGKSIKGPPAATLNTATFQAVTEPIPREDLLKTLVLSMHGKRSSEYAPDAFSPIKPLDSKKRNTKRKTLEASPEAKDVLKHRDPSSVSATDIISDMDSSPERAEDGAVISAKRAKRACTKRKGA
ncbi:hypothetical protein C0989_002772 [Termitomyces sp. Mn162]|nr:hypothetical protein C0989_002772 [Termitomyces sp. Mn162]